MDWFTVDRQGLAKILTRKGVAHIVLEPLSNAWDERVSRVDVTLERIPCTRAARLVVADDSPEGFADLSHAYKLFAESAKKSDSTRRGRFNAGDKAVAYDPSDPEANSLAVSSGFTVVHGGSMSKAEWEAVRRAGTVIPAGQVTPSPKPFSPDGKPLTYIPEEKWTPDIAASVAYFHRVSKRMVGRDLRIHIVSEVSWPFRATYGGGQLIFNLGRLGHSFFAGPLAPKNDLLLHELGHERSGNHLSAEYHDALTEFGAKLTQLALEEPQLFVIQ
jgi:hypothetical protein